MKKLSRHLDTIRRQLRHPYSTARKHVNFLISYLESRLGLASRALARPFTCYVDIASTCNLRCPLCPTGQRRKGRKGEIMSMEVFRRALDQLGPFLYDVHLYNWGEPLLNPRVAEMVALAHARGIGTCISSNGNVLPEGLAEGLVQGGLDRLVLSVDGATQEAYEQYRAGGNLEKVIDHAREILAARKRLGRRTPRVVWQFLTMRHNQHEIDAVRKLAADVGVDEVSFEWFRTDMCEELFTPLDRLVDKYRDWIPTLPEYTKYDLARRTTRMGRGRCLQPWYRVVVDPSGDVFPCCSIFESRYAFGNLLEADLGAIWNGPAFRAARVEQGRTSKNAEPWTVCRVCQIFPKAEKR